MLLNKIYIFLLVYDQFNFFFFVVLIHLFVLFAYLFFLQCSLRKKVKYKHWSVVCAQHWSLDNHFVVLGFNFAGFSFVFFGEFWTQAVVSLFVLWWFFLCIFCVGEHEWSVFWDQYWSFWQSFGDLSVLFCWCFVFLVFLGFSIFFTKFCKKFQLFQHTVSKNKIRLVNKRSVVYWSQHQFGNHFSAFFLCVCFCFLVMLFFVISRFFAQIFQSFLVVEK